MLILGKLVYYYVYFKRIKLLQETFVYVRVFAIKCFIGIYFYKFMLYLYCYSI